MLTKIRTKISSLVEDLDKTDFEVFIYTTSSIFTLAEENISNITKVLKNGVELGSGQYSYDSTTNKITIIASLTADDKIEVNYTYTKYSDTELDGYIRAALVWISVYSTSDQDFELETTTIEPTPTNREMDLIALVSSILIKPDYSEYRLPNLTVRYPRTMTKEKKIEMLIQKFNMGIGVSDVLEWDFKYWGV